MNLYNYNNTNMKDKNRSIVKPIHIIILSVLVAVFIVVIILFMKAKKEKNKLPEGELHNNIEETKTYKTDFERKLDETVGDFYGYQVDLHIIGDCSRFLDDCLLPYLSNKDLYISGYVSPTGIDIYIHTEDVPEQYSLRVFSNENKTYLEFGNLGYYYYDINTEEGLAMADNFFFTYAEKCVELSKGVTGKEIKEVVYQLLNMEDIKGGVSNDGTYAVVCSSYPQVSGTAFNDFIGGYRGNLSMSITSSGNFPERKVSILGDGETDFELTLSEYPYYVTQYSDVVGEYLFPEIVNPE